MTANTGNRIPTHKICATCKTDLPRSAYNYRKLVSGTVTLESSCRECHKKTAKASRERKALERTQALNPVNSERRKKRKKLTAKFHRTPAFQAAGDAAYKRAGGRCEFVEIVMRCDGVKVRRRCRATEQLERHCLRYPKTRPIEARDIQILCDPHHNYIEMTKHSYRHSRGA